MGSQDPRNDRLPRSWIAARSLRSSALSLLFPPRYRFPISPILPPRLSPPCVYTCARIEPTRIPRCLFLSTRTPLYDVPSLGHDLFLLFSLPLSACPSTGSDGETSNTGENACPRCCSLLRPPTRPSRDKISRISGGNYPMKEDSTERSYIPFRNLREG